jgi:hypothetical protein
MWKTVSNIISESLQAVSVLMGSHDYNRELKKTINSAERFVNWGKESQNLVDFQEALSLLEKAPLKTASNSDKLKIMHIQSIALLGIIASKENDLEKFNQRISKKYDTDDYMTEVLNNISNRMKELQTIISVSESGDTETLKSLLGDKKSLDVRPEEITLDARKEYESIEDNFISKKSIKENKINEINHFKNTLANEVIEYNDEVLTLIVEMEKLDDLLTSEEKEQKNKIKEEVSISLNSVLNHLKEKNLPLQPIKAKK